MHNQSASRTVAVIGAGKVGTAMAHLLSVRGYEIAAVCDPRPEARERAAALTGAEPVEQPGQAARDASIILITTPDSSIEEACEALAGSADLQGRKVIHMSGALSLGVLGAAARAGASVLCVHPIQTFADLEGAERSLPGSTFGVTCAGELEGWARGFVETLGGRAVMVADEDKVLYHAAAAIACNLLTMVDYASYVINRRLGMSDEQTAAALGPLSAATLANVSRLGPARSLTGPLARGDVETIGAHIQALERIDAEMAGMYKAVSAWGLKLVEEAGELPEATVRRMKGMLEK